MQPTSAVDRGCIVTLRGDLHIPTFKFKFGLFVNSKVGASSFSELES
jgi:hypothetical protein